MKRFLILLWGFAVLLAITAKAEEAQKAACVCKEGEKNCPCLAQAEKQEQPKRPPPPGDSMPKVSVKPRKLMVTYDLPKHPGRDFHPHIRVKVPTRKLLPYLKFSVMPRPARLPIKQELKKLRALYRENKSKMAVLGASITQAPLADKPRLTAERTGFESKCAELKKEIRATKMKLRMLRLQYRVQCAKKLKQQVTIAEKRKTILIQKIKEVKIKIQDIKDTIKIAPPADQPRLCQELKVLKAVLKKRETRLKTGIKLIHQVKVARKKAETVALKKKLVKIRTSLTIKLKKLEETKSKKVELKGKADQLKAQVKVLKTQLVKGSLATNDRIMIKRKLKAMRRSALLIKKMYIRVSKVEHKLKFKVKTQGLVVKAIKKVLKKRKTATKCLRLQGKLAKEMMHMKKLKEAFDQECNKAIQSRKRQDIKRVLTIKLRIDATKTLITKLRRKIRYAPAKQRAKLVRKEKYLVKKLKQTTKVLRKVKRKIETVAMKCKAAIGDEQKVLEEERVGLIQKESELAKEIVRYEKLIEIVRMKHRQRCADAVSRERKRSKEIITNMKRKLELANKQAEQLKIALENAKKATALQIQADKLKSDALATQSISLKTELKKQRATLKAKIAELKKVEMGARRKAREIRKELTQKSRKEVRRERRLAQRKEEEIQDQMQAAMAKERALRKALANAHDQALKDALAQQHKLELKRLRKLSIVLRETHMAKRALDHDLQLIIRESIERKKEAELQHAILLKNLRLKLNKHKIAFLQQSALRKKTEVTNLKTIEGKNLAAMKKKLKLAKIEYATYKAALKAANKKKILSILATLRKKFEDDVEKLQAALKQEHLNAVKYKMEMAKATSESLRALKKKLLAESKAKSLEYTKKLAQAQAQGAAALKAAKLRHKVRISHEKARTKTRILGLQKEIDALRKTALARELALTRRLSAAESRNSELKTELELGKKQVIQKEKEIVAWKKQQQEEFEAASTRQKKATDNEKHRLEEMTARITRRGLKIEADLQAKLQSLKAEIKTDKASLLQELANYQKLKGEMAEWTLNKNKMISVDQAEFVQKRQVYIETMNKKIEECHQLLLKLQLRLTTLKMEFEKKIVEIREIHEVAEQRKKAKEEIDVYESQYTVLMSEALKLRGAIEETCTGAANEGEDLATPCPKIRGEYKELVEKAKALKAEMGIKIQHFISL